MRGIHNAAFKRRAILLRRRGWSYPMIARELLVARGTLHGWFSGLQLSERVKRVLLARKRASVAKARVQAAASHRRTNALQRDSVLQEVKRDLASLAITPVLAESLLAMLYWAEGSKARSETALGSADPSMMRLYVELFRALYDVDERKFRCYLHLRSDQDEAVEKRFWSKILDIPQDQFRKTQFDQRTLGKKTRTGYHGVCTVHYYSAAFEKRLSALQMMLPKKLLNDGMNTRAVSSVG